MFVQSVGAAHNTDLFLLLDTLWPPFAYNLPLTHTSCTPLRSRFYGNVRLNAAATQPHWERCCRRGTAGYLPCLGLLIVGKNAFAIRLAASPFQQLACIMSAARGYNVACRA
ncbi:MAG: hypothetical protein ACFNTC_05040, partial [Prevotella sp.]